MSKSINCSIGVSCGDTKYRTRRFFRAVSAALAGAMLMSFAVGCGDDGVSGNGGGGGGGGNGGGGNGGGSNNNNPVLPAGEAWTLCDFPEEERGLCLGMIFNANGTITMVRNFDGGVWYYVPNPGVITYQANENRITTIVYDYEDGNVALRAESSYSVSTNTITLSHVSCESYHDNFECADEPEEPTTLNRTQNVNPIPWPDNLFRTHTNSDQIFGKRSSRNR